MQNSIINDLLPIIAEKLNLPISLNYILKRSLESLPEITFGQDYYYWIDPDDLTIRVISPEEPDFDPELFTDIYFLIEDHKNLATDSVLRFSIY